MDARARAPWPDGDTAQSMALPVRRCRQRAAAAAYPSSSPVMAFKTVWFKMANVSDVGISMGRPKKFSRESVLEKALPVFWQYGYAGTSLHQLEQATGVNKSGLYAEFEGKDDLFLNALLHYYANRGADRILASTPKGWGNIERFLRLGETGEAGCVGCFSVNSLREFASLPERSREAISAYHRRLLPDIVENIEAEKHTMPASTIAEIVMVFFSGFCIENNLDGAPPLGDPVAAFMSALRQM
nr:TetR/AcrR family transcriptional regulator [Burkholderia gladioli]